VLEQRLATGGLTVPTEDDLATLGLRAAEIAAAVRAGRLLRLAPGVVLLTDTVRRSVRMLAELPQPFTAGEAREALGTTRKVIIPLLEHLTLQGQVRRAADGRHMITGR
jgi:selenocysteine-specific elongation factor